MGKALKTRALFAERLTGCFLLIPEVVRTRLCGIRSVDDGLLAGKTPKKEEEEAKTDRRRLENEEADDGLLTLSQIAFFLDPFHRMFSISDLNISYPHAEVERVSVRMCSPPPRPKLNRRPPAAPLTQPAPESSHELRLRPLHPSVRPHPRQLRLRRLGPQPPPTTRQQADQPQQTHNQHKHKTRQNKPQPSHAAARLRRPEQRRQRG